MILYHGSNLAVEKPDISYSRANVDFGRGFYTTPIQEQAIQRLRYKKPNLQYCFRSQSVIDAYLKFTASEVLK